MFALVILASPAQTPIVDFENKVNYKHLDSIQFMVMAPSASLMFVKLEHNEIEGETQPSAYATAVESSEWQTLTLNFSGLTGEDIGHTPIFFL